METAKQHRMMFKFFHCFLDFIMIKKGQSVKQESIGHAPTCTINSIFSCDKSTFVNQVDVLHLLQRTWKVLL